MSNAGDIFARTGAYFSLSLGIQSAFPVGFSAGWLDLFLPLDFVDSDSSPEGLDGSEPFIHITACRSVLVSRFLPDDRHRRYPYGATIVWRGMSKVGVTRTYRGEAGDRQP